MPLKDFNAQIQIADAIREVRARGVTLPGVAELIVEYHTALHVLQNLDNVKALGEALACDANSELGAKMRALLSDAAAKEVKAEPIPITDLTERAVKHVMKAGYSEEAARQIVAEHGADTVLAGENEVEESSKPATPQPPTVPSGAVAGSAPDAAASAGATGLATPAAGSSPETPVVAPESETSKTSEPSPNAAA